MSVSVIVPWKPGCAHRERILPWVLNWWENLGAAVEVGVCDGEWSKATAVADALGRMTADTLIIADADVIVTDVDAIRLAVDSLVSHGWAVPHRNVWRWNETATNQLMSGHEPDPTDIMQRPYLGWLGGGITVITRALYEAVPLDPRFVGWGQEDESFALALRCLAGEPWRGDTDLWHLYHPPQERRTRRWGSEASQRLAQRYERAARTPRAMRELLGEAR